MEGSCASRRQGHASSASARRLVGKQESTPQEQSERIEQEILTVVSEGEAHGAVDQGQTAMIQSVMELNTTTVSAIMTPRTDIVGVPATATLDEVRDTISRKREEGVVDKVDRRRCPFDIEQQRADWHVGRHTCDGM